MPDDYWRDACAIHSRPVLTEVCLRRRVRTEANIRLPARIAIFEHIP